VDVVLNCVGILRERGGETYDRVHNMAPAALGEACRRMRVRLVHVSALGLRPDARSRFLRSKLIAERKIMASGADYSIVRPACWMARAATARSGCGASRNGPFTCTPRTRRACSHRCTCATWAKPSPCSASAAARDGARSSWAAVRGARWPTTGRLTERPRGKADGHRALRIPVPAPLARFGAHLCDLLHFSPYSYGHLELMRRDNVPRVNSLPVLLGRAATPVGRDLPELRPAYAFAAMPAVVPTGHETPVPPSPQ
jgi:NADH dehydrogenase